MLNIIDAANFLVFLVGALAVLESFDASENGGPIRQIHFIEISFRKFVSLEMSVLQSFMGCSILQSFLR